MTCACNRDHITGRVLARHLRLASLTNNPLCFFVYVYVGGYIALNPMRATFLHVAPWDSAHCAL